MINRDELEGAIGDILRLQQSYDDPQHFTGSEQFRIDRGDSWNHLSVSGSNDWNDWVQNLSAWWWWKFQKTIPGTRFKATTGYVQAAERIAKKIIKGNLLEKDVPLFIGGHSAGGPEGAITGILLLQEEYDVRGLRTFGSPRWSTMDIDLPLIRFSSRYVANGDVIPEFPKPWPAIGRNWRHLGNGYTIGSKVDDYYGVVRDGYKTHMPPNYHKCLIEELSHHV